MCHLIKVLCMTGIQIINRMGYVDRTNIPKLIQIQELCLNEGSR